MLNKSVSVGWLALAALAGSVWGQEVAETPAAPWTAQERRLVDRPDEIVAVLENGLTVIVKENHTAPVAAVRLYVRTGSIYEEERLGSGISHLFEHLLAGGATKSRTEAQSRQIIQNTGAEFNAYTAKDHTCYYLTVPAQHVGTALNLIADWVTRPLFPEDTFASQWGVVQRELEMRAADPYSQLNMLFDELRYRVHPARYPIIGYQTVVQQITNEDIHDYYRTKYVPDNAVMVIVGDINAAEMLQAIKTEFADFIRHSTAAPVLPDEPEVTSPRHMVKVNPALQGPAQMMLAFPSFKLQDEDLYALDTLAGIMGQGKSSRLYRSLREEEQLLLSVTAYNDTPSWAKGSFVIHCEVLPENVGAVRQAVAQQIARLQNEAVTAEELDRTKRQLQVDYIRSRQTAVQQASGMGRDFLATGDAHFSDHYVENMQQVTAEKVQLAAQKYLLAPRQLTLILTPVPLAADLTTAAKVAPDTAIKKITLENGLRVLLKRNAAVPLINFQVFFLGGLLEETDENNGITHLMTQLSLKGTENYSAEQIVDYFDGIGGVIGARCGNNTFLYSGEVMPQDFEQALAIYSEIVLNPTFPDDELGKLKEESLVGIAKIKNNWAQEALKFFRGNFFVNNPYRRLWQGQSGSVEAITWEQIEAFHEQGAVGSRGVLAIFGDIDVNAAEALVRRHFGAMPSGAAIDLGKIPADPSLEEPRRFVQETEKIGATITIGYPGMKLTNIQDRYPMDVLTEIIGSNSGWLFETLRDQQLVYYARGMSFPGVIAGYITATAQCEAAKAQQVIGITEQLLRKAAEGQISEEEVLRAKNNRINGEILQKQTNADAAMSAALDELYGFGFDWSQGHADRVMAVTLDDVKTVAKKYLTGPATITIVTSEPDAPTDNTAANK